MSIYPPGQCTDYAATREPWVARYGNLGNAKEWTANWRKHGGLFSNVPVIGAIACFQPGVDGSFADGHVAVVVAVGTGHFTVAEENGPAGPGHIDSRVVATVAGIAWLVQSAPAPAPAPSPSPPPAGAIVWVNFNVTVQRAHPQVDVRLGPFENAGKFRVVHAGNSLGCDGYAYGTADMDAETHRPDHRWYHINAASGYGWIASAYVDGNAPGSHA